MEEEQSQEVSTVVVYETEEETWQELSLKSTAFLEFVEQPFCSAHVGCFLKFIDNWDKHLERYQRYVYLDCLI